MRHREWDRRLHGDGFLDRNGVRFWLPESVTVAVNAKVSAVDGTPRMFPLASSETPGGSEPAVTAHV